MAQAIQLLAFLTLLTTHSRTVSIFRCGIIYNYAKYAEGKMCAHQRDISIAHTSEKLKNYNASGIRSFLLVKLAGKKIRLFVYGLTSALLYSLKSLTFISLLDYYHLISYVLRKMFSNIFSFIAPVRLQTS